MKQKILFFDIDDTLVHHSPAGSYIPDSARKSVEALQKAGHITALASGRSLKQTEPVQEALGIDTIVCFNGLMVESRGRTLFRQPLDQGELKQILPKIPEKVPVLAMDEEGVYVKHSEELRAYSFLGHTGPERDDGPFNSFSRFLRPFTGELKDYFLLAVFDPNLDRDWPYRRLTLKPWAQAGFEIANRSLSKLTGIRLAAEAFGMEPDDIYVFGDSYNDLEMLEGIPHSTCMGNGAEAAKAKAAYVTAPVDEDGIARACRHWGFPV